LSEATKSAAGASHVNGNGAALISREVAVRKGFAFGRMWRDSWLSWPARVGPVIAEALDVDAATLTVMLEQHLRDHLTDLARERVEF